MERDMVIYGGNIHDRYGIYGTVNTVNARVR